MITTNIISQAEMLSEATRKRLELDNAPIKDIFNLLEGQGIFVVKMPIKCDELSGAFYYDKKTKKSQILINSDRTPGHQNFTAAHEFYHFLSDKEKEPIVIDVRKNAKTDQEIKADCFAANFLMPKKGLKYYLEDVLKIKDTKINHDEYLVKIRNEFGVSWQALLYRLKDLGYIFNKPCKEKIKDISSLNFLSEQMGFGTELPNEDGKLKLPSEYYRLAFSAYFKDKISLGKLSELLYVSYEEAKDEVARLRRIGNEKSR